MNEDGEEDTATIEEVVKEIDNSLHQMYEALPQDSFMIVTSGQANLSSCSRLLKHYDCHYTNHTPIGYGNKRKTMKVRGPKTTTANCERKRPKLAQA